MHVTIIVSVAQGVGAHYVKPFEREDSFVQECCASTTPDPSCLARHARFTGTTRPQGA